MGLSMTRRTQLLEVLEKTCEPRPSQKQIDAAIKKLNAMKIIQAAIKMDSDLRELRENADAASKRFFERTKEIHREGGAALLKKVQWEKIESHKFNITSLQALGREDYRQAVMAKVAQAETKLATDESDPSIHGRFTGVLETNRPDTSQCDVVYAIIAKWTPAGKPKRTLVEALPFFSKVNLRRHVDSLRRMGYRASYKRIEVI